MKRLLIALVATAFLFACNNEKKTDESSVKTEEKTESVAINYPYKPAYSSDFSVGDANHAKMVLDLYKMWEENKLDEMKALLADSVSIEFPDGNKFADNTADSMINFAKQVRKQIASIKVEMDGWMPVKSNDKKDDYVLTYSRDYTTDASGKKDSTRVHAYFLIKNNKIRSWSEFQQKLAPPPPPKK
jgi:ketosteroid isomerase-like protein